MTEKLIDMLRGNTNTLGRTEEAVEAVLQDRSRIHELFELYYQDDEWVRLRTSSTLKRLWRSDKQIVAPFIPRWVDEVALINQPSVHWTFAQMIEECENLLSIDQKENAIRLIKEYLEVSDDWIVLNSSIQTLGKYAASDTGLATWLRPKLKKLQKNEKKSVARRATKTLQSLQDAQ